MPSDFAPALRVDEVVRLGMKAGECFHRVEVGHRPNARARVAASRDEVLLEGVETQRENGGLMSTELGALESRQIDQMDVEIGRSAS